MLAPLLTLAAVSTLLGQSCALPPPSPHSPPGPPGPPEYFIDTTWWDANSGGASDEWGLCANLGSRCGPVLENRYAIWITYADIDKSATANINVLRIPTTYAAWIKLPGTQLYSGNQQKYLKDIALYAIKEYNMHIIVDIHSLPGGVNVDNTAFSAFGSPYALSDLTNFTKGVLKRVGKVNAKIPVMLQDGFKGESYFPPSFDETTNLVFDIHSYYFAGRNACAANVSSYICTDAKAAVGDGKFPVFVGEWAIEAQYNNTFALRQGNLAAGLYAFGKKTSGSAYWTAKRSPFVAWVNHNNSSAHTHP
ncbi:unnamed protein product [Aureobasidium vineae]|uniref:glucan 1,3-beta-glucosidase n=1 Tax=Aureobasidium vineae TaxID=2773715 RepID=A0A9N8PJH6_9PEZI|nr:unnamed protein product [Aureobasidium vineae]